MPEILVSANGLKKAIDDALKLMDDDGTQGVSYPIGRVRGMPVRIVIEPEVGCFETTKVEGGQLTYEAVDEGS